jgi:hypothetical protein
VPIGRDGVSLIDLPEVVSAIFSSDEGFPGMGTFPFPELQLLANLEGLGFICSCSQFCQMKPPITAVTTNISFKKILCFQSVFPEKGSEDYSDSAKKYDSGDGVRETVHGDSFRHFSRNGCHLEWNFW